MPVVVTGADTPLGERVVAALSAPDVDLRATVDDRGAVPALVAAGVKTAVSDLVDTERFGAVVEGAHTVIHLRGGGAAAILDGVGDVLAALPDSGVVRVVTLAGTGGATSAHPALRDLDDSDVDTVVLHVGVVLAPLADPRSELPRLPATVDVAPVWVDDLVAAIVAADRLRDLRGHLHVDAVGPDVVTAARLMELLGSVPPGGVEDVVDEPVDLVGDRGRALREVLGVAPRSLDDAIRAARLGL